MAGHWENRIVQRINEDTGKRYNVTIRVWVVDAASKKAPTGPSAAVKAAAKIAAQAAARTAAARSAATAAGQARARALQLQAQQEYQRRLAEARKEAYLALQKKQTALLAKTNLVKGRDKAVLTTIQKNQTNERREQFAAAASSRAAAATTAQKTQHAAEVERWRLYTEQQRKAAAIRLSKIGDTKSAKELEYQLDKARQDAQRNGTADSTYINAVQDKYEAHANAVYAKYEQIVAKINAALKAGKIDTARSLYYGKAFAASQAEFTRLFGNGKNPLRDGSYNAFHKNMTAVGDAQREWWKKQMHASLNGLHDRLVQLQQTEKRTGEHFGDQTKYLKEQIAIFDGTGLRKVIDHWERKGDHNVPVYRQQTVQEALQEQQARLIMEQQRIAAERGVQEKRTKALDLAEGNVRVGNQVVSRRDMSIVKAAKRLWGDSMPDTRRPQDVQAAADALVNQWVTDNPQPSNKDPNYNVKYDGWRRIKDAYEKEAYAFFGANAPGFLDRFVSAPGISHGLSALQAPVSAIGAGLRALNATIFGESKVGGFSPDLSHLPSHVQMLVENKEKQFNASHGGGQGRAQSLWVAQREQIIRDFLATSEGQKWQSDDVSRQRRESGKEDLAFAGGFYGSGDLGSKVDALNQYGSSPTTSGGANLLFQLLADPTNAIPLNFTTYVARGKYAFEAAEKAKGLLGANKVHAAAKSFLTVDEGTLELRKFAGEAKDAIEKQGLTIDRAVQMFQERVAGITEKSELKDQFHQWMKAIGLDPRKISEGQVFNLIEHLATKKAGDEGVDFLTQTRKFNDTTKSAIAKAEAEAKRTKETTLAEASKVKSSTTRRVEKAGAARERLSIQRAEQEEALKVKAESARARPKPVLKHEPTVSGPTDSVVAAAEHKAIVKEVRALPKRPASHYDSADEFFKTDTLGNKFPLTFRPDEDYRKLADAARSGDQSAREQLINRARYERNRFRMENEDLAGLPGVRRRDIKFKPTKFDLAERAGTVSNEVATARLIADRKIVRQLKRTAAIGNKSDDWIRSFTRPYRSKANRSPLAGPDLEGVSKLDEFGDLRSQMVENRVSLGDDIIEARESTLRGVKDLYETFSHDGTKFYPGLSGFDATKLTPYQFKRIVARLGDAGLGAGAFRDGGQLIFEVFHQLRLAKDWDKLRELSDFMSVVIRDRPDNIWGWMWKTMEERSVLPYSMHISDIRAGFYHAAEAFNLHPELAFSTIPSGYYAGRLPISFGLSARLQGLVDKTSDLFHVAPKAYTKELAKKEVTRMFHGGAGEPTRVLHYVAERYGDFVGGSEITLRMKDEMIHALNLSLPQPDLLALAMKRVNLIPQQVVELAERRGVALEEFLRRDLVDGLPHDKPLIPGQKAVTAGPRSRYRPEYQNFRASIEAAYWAGEVPGLNGRVHTMMMLSRLQTNPDAYIGTLRTYMTYMTKLGGADLAQAKRLVHELYEGEIATDVTRINAETIGKRPGYRDAITGETIKHSDKSRIALWREFDFMPSDEGLLAYAQKRATKRDELNEEFAREAERGTWLAEDAAPPMNKYTGSINTLDFTANVDQLVADMRTAKTPAAQKRAQNSLEGTIRSFMDRNLDDAAGNFDQVSLDAIKRAMDHVAETPEGARFITKVREELGTVRVREVLKSRAADPRFEQRLGRHELPPKREPAAPVEDVWEAQPIAPVPVSRPLAEQTYDRVFNMSESEWFKHEKERANRVLTSKVASVERKKAARARIKDIDAAEYIVKVEKKQGAYIPWRERVNVRDRVLKMHGKAVEDLVAPKMISPLALSASDAAVEQFRTYWRLLNSASDVPVPSPVKGITVGGVQLDHIPKAIWDHIEQRVSDAIAEARGFRADTRTRGRRQSTNLESQRPIGRLSDTDPIVIKAKERALFEYAKDTGNRVGVHAYDEVRKAVWKGYVQNRTAKWLLARAQKIVDRTGADLEKTFLDLRAKEAKIEARRQLGALAFGELFGHNPDAILAEFVRRYSDDGMLRSFTPELSPFQKATLEAHMRDLSGLDVLDARVGSYLQSANMPPLSSRQLTREFLTRTGAWSPRTADDFLQGARSWSIWDEAEYWRTAYGEVPEWTDARLLETEFNAIFHDESLYFDQMKAWGIFSRSQELQLRLDGKTAEEIERAILNGDETLGVQARRELAQQRKYVIERYGKLVSKDGNTLDSMPWLMNPEEYKTYLAKNPSKTMPEGMIQSVEELDEFTAMVEKAMRPFWDKYVMGKLREGEQVTFQDIFKVSSEVQAQMLANPKWAARHRDWIGKGLDRWAWFNRWLVFSNPAFLVTNAVDVPIKTAYYRLTRRGLFSAELARDAKYADAAAGLTPLSMGLDATTAMYRVKQAGSLSRLKSPRGLTGIQKAADRALALVDGTGELFPTLAGRAELAAKMHLARSMYPKVYDELLKTLKDPKLADAAAKDFIKGQVSKMWPTAGTGPIEKLWNRVVPFSSYSVRNKVLFISEAVKHPMILNYIDRIGDFIEEENVRNWERDHPGTEMPENLRRMIELPWAKGHYLDLSTFSDAARGLKPIFDAEKPKSILDQTAAWLRLVNPGVQAGVYALFNAFKIGQKQQWVAELDASGYPTGRYKLVTTGWTEPWSQNQPDLASVFWFGEAFKSAAEFGVNGWTPGEVSLLLGQALLFNGIKTYDRAAVMASFYFNLKAKDNEAAAAWLINSEDGRLVQDWLVTKASDPHEAMNRLKDIERAGKDQYAWYHSLNAKTQANINAGRDKIKDIRAIYEAALFDLTPGTPEYREMKARMYMAIDNVYLNNPDLLMSNVYGKTAAEWSNQLEDWQTDKLMDDFMALAQKRPSRADYETTTAYNKAVAAWELQKQTYLQQYPQVAARLNSGRSALSSVRDQIEKEWNTVFSRISERTEQIDAAKAIIASAGRDSVRGRAAQDRLDALYLAQELDYSLLERDHAATFFSDQDFNKLPFGVQGPASLKGNFVKRSVVFNDFDRARYEKASREGRLDEFMAKQEYGQNIKDAISYAKRGDPFGEFDPKRWGDYMAAHPDLQKKYFANNPDKAAKFAQTAKYIEGIRSAVNFAKSGGSFDAGKFVQYMKSHPDLLEAYFKRHPEKRSLWGQTDAYIKNISRWGKLVGASKWDEAAKMWDSLPQWVKDRYYDKHPEKRKRAAQTVQYLGMMKRWVSFFDKGDKKGAMSFFNSLPNWVKERYYSKHPENRAKFELDNKMSVKLQNYFAAPKEDQAKYLSQNPDLQKWLAKNSPSGAGNRSAILAAYQSIPSDEAWLRRVFREKYPEIFSKEAAGERKLKGVYDSLSKHPQVLPAFEEWVKAIWASYALQLTHGPRPLSSFVHSERKVPARAFTGSLSAADASRYLPKLIRSPLT